MIGERIWTVGSNLYEAVAVRLDLEVNPRQITNR